MDIHDIQQEKIFALRIYRHYIFRKFGRKIYHKNSSRNMFKLNLTL